MSAVAGAMITLLLLVFAWIDRGELSELARAREKAVIMFCYSSVTY